MTDTKSPPSRDDTSTRIAITASRQLRSEVLASLHAARQSLDLLRSAVAQATASLVQAERRMFYLRKSHGPGPAALEADLTGDR